MGVLITDDVGQPKPQFENTGGTGFESWKGASGHGNVRSDDGQIVSIGAKADAAVTNTASPASVIALLKGLISKTGVTTVAFDWSGAVAADGFSTEFDVSGVRSIDIFGYVGNDNTITVYAGNTSTSMYPITKTLSTTENGFAPYLHLDVSFKFLSLKLTNASTIAIKIAGKS